MANHYLEFSELLKLPEDVDREKVEKIIVDFKNACDEDDEDFSVAYGFEKEGLWIHSDECGNPGNAAEIVHRVMKALDIDGCFTLSYCYYCSKLRLSEFGGGVILVTKNGTKDISPGDIANKIEKAVKDGASINDNLTVAV